MRTIAVLMPLLALGAAPPADAPPVPPDTALEARVVSPVPSNCRSPQLAVTDRRLGPRKLAELPQAHAYQAVFRRGPDGCPDPLLVSERIGWSRDKPRN